MSESDGWMAAFRETFPFALHQQGEQEQINAVFVDSTPFDCCRLCVCEGNK